MTSSFLFLSIIQNGKIAPQLTDEDLKDMGIKIVGDRCRMRHLIKSFGRKARQIQRTKVRIHSLIHSLHHLLIYGYMDIYIYIYAWINIAVYAL